MLGAVGPAASGRFEGLQNYVIGNKRAPPDVPSARVKPRLAGDPGARIPGTPSVIPTSSQRPGKRTNDTVPYARVVFTEFHDSPANPTDVLPGDVVLVHRTSASLGHDSNRASKVASWRQLNAFFSKRSPDVVLGAGTPTQRIEAARSRARKTLLDVIADGLLECEPALARECRTELQRHTASRLLADAVAGGLELSAVVAQTLARKRRDAQKKRAVVATRTDIAERILRMSREYDRLRNAPKTHFLPEFDWQAVLFVADWTPDGVLLSRDDDERNSSHFAAGSGESGTVLNIAVQGPAATRNTKSGKDAAQVFDEYPAILDDLYLLLVAVPSESRVSYSFQYRPTSGRVLSDLTDPRRTWLHRPRSEHPPEIVALSNAVHAWRIGRVMEVKARSSTTSAFVTTNVCIVPVPIYDLRERFGDLVGSRLRADHDEAL